MKQYVYLQARFPDIELFKVVLVSFQFGYIFIQTDKTLYTPNSKGESSTTSVNQNIWYLIISNSKKGVYTLLQPLKAQLCSTLDTDMDVAFWKLTDTDKMRSTTGNHGGSLTNSSSEQF